MNLYDAVLRRRISLADASRLADAIMEQAEMRRSYQIDEEATLAFDLETYL